MNLDRLARLEDLTRRYAKNRPCGAGLGVLWGGVLLGLLEGMLVGWMMTEYVARPDRSTGFWRFSRTAQLATPSWLGWVALATPFLAWLGLMAIQGWVDRRCGAVESREGSNRYPKWAAPKMVAAMACLFFVLQAWDSPSALMGFGSLGILAVAAWAFVWGRNCRDGLTQTVMLFLSIPPLFILAGTGAASRLGSANLLTFGAYSVFMLVMLIKGAVRFTGFLKVSRELAAIPPVGE